MNIYYGCGTSFKMYYTSVVYKGNDELQVATVVPDRIMKPVMTMCGVKLKQTVLGLQYVRYVHYAYILYTPIINS